MPALCFVLMPFGQKPAANGTLIDFDAIYDELIWEPETTAGNLRLIREARERCGEQLPWAVDLERELINRPRR